MPTTPLLDWLDEPAADRGIRFAEPHGWDTWSYERLATRARRFADGARVLGVARDDVVTIVTPSGPSFVAALFGTMRRGAVPSPFAPPMAFQDGPAYTAHVRAALAAAAPRLVVTTPDLVADLVAVAPGGHVVTVDEVEAAGDPTVSSPGPGSLALLQFTSGSSGAARGVRVPFRSLEANTAAIARWLRMTRDDATASWLPVHHDMGLIGCLITPVVNGSDLWLLRPEHFVRSPLRFLRCFDAGGARLTAMPNFGLAYIARRVAPHQLDGLDLSAWRAVIVGAERLDADAFERFRALLAPHGFRRRALLPAYGLAEGTLAVTGLPLDEEWRPAVVDRRRVAMERPVAGVDDEADADGRALTVVGCGRPLAGVDVTVAGEDGAPLADGTVGEIVVRGPSVADGYLAPSAGSTSRFAGGALHTGDAGFVVEGQLYVLGRLGDALKVRGRSVFAEDLEAALVAAGLPVSRLAVVLGMREGEPTAVAVLEGARAEWVTEARETLRRRCEIAEVVVALVPRGTIGRTSSGKPKRRALWLAFAGGDLDATAHA